MRRIFARGLVCAMTVLWLSSPARADDVIFSPYTEQRALMDWIEAANKMLAEVVRTFFRGLTADPNGVEHPNPSENPIDQFTKRIGNSGFQILLQGAGNLRAIGGPLYYNELQGGVGMEYDLVRDDGTDTGTMVALRVSPLYGEFAMIRVGTGGPAVSGLPQSVFLGSSFGLEMAKRFGIFEPGFRAYARPEKQIGGEGNAGVSLYSSVYCRIRLSELEEWDHGVKRRLSLKPTFAVYDKGDAKAEFYPHGVTRMLWEATVSLEVH